MARVSKVFEFILPIKNTQYNIGNRYTAIKKYISDGDKGFKISLINKESTNHDEYGRVESTIKHLHLHSKIPSMIKKLIPDAACTVTETSYYNEEIIFTSYKNNHFSNEVFSIKIETRISEENPFPDVEKETINIAGDEESIKCYKKMDVEVNNFFLGWIANEISKSIKNQIIDHHTLMINTKDTWLNKSQADIDELEEETFNLNK
ncbi:hypothetical protein P3W45_001703 [Vairimorpha bombi]|jgi:hypothetical protein